MIAIAEQVVLPRTHTRRRTMPPLQQAAALYEHRVTLPSETQVKIATLGDQLAELRASMAALQARIDLLARW